MALTPSAADQEAGVVDPPAAVGLHVGEDAVADLLQGEAHVRLCAVDSRAHAGVFLHRWAGRHRTVCADRRGAYPSCRSAHTVDLSAVGATASVCGERRLGRLRGTGEPDADRRGDRHDAQHQDRGAEAVERTGEGEHHERADELADEEGRRPDAGAAAPLLEGERTQGPGQQRGQDQAVAEPGDDREDDDQRERWTPGPCRPGRRPRGRRRAAP